MARLNILPIITSPDAIELYPVMYLDVDVSMRIRKRQRLVTVSLNQIYGMQESDLSEFTVFPFDIGDLLVYY